MLVKQRLHRMRELSPKATEGAKKCPLYLILPLDEIIQYKYIIAIHYYLIPNKSSPPVIPNSEFRIPITPVICQYTHLKPQHFVQVYKSNKNDNKC